MTPHYILITESGHRVRINRPIPEPTLRKPMPPRRGFRAFGQPLPTWAEQQEAQE